MAVKNGNSKGAQQAMHRHLQNVEDILLKKKKGGVRNRRFPKERSHP
jgi:DNA-binding FadR family transcriptional regulator